MPAVLVEPNNIQLHVSPVLAAAHEKQLMKLL
jgi:hypothetical protein